MEQSKISPVRLSLALASIASGAVHGYCDAQGIEFSKENLEWGLTYAPIIVQGAFGAIKWGGVGLMGGGAAGISAGKGFLERIIGGSGGAVIGTAVGAGLGGIGGAIKGGFQMAAGYGIGYLAGYVMR